MRLKRLLPALLALLSVCSAFSQQIIANRCMEVIGVFGLSAEKLGKKFDATLGEPVISTLETADQNTIITQGFHQPECAMTIVQTADIQSDMNIQIFPNPVFNQLFVQYNHPLQQVLKSRIFAVSGQLVSDWSDTVSSAPVDCSALSAGWYVLELLDPQTGAKAVVQFIKLDY